MSDPALVERLAPVAGTTVPAFVERREMASTTTSVRVCRRDYGPGLR